jgi:Txe/YoeB family toxin of Txe-Axe toxin-antitoxin module
MIGSKMNDSAAYSNRLNDISRLVYDALKPQQKRIDELSTILIEIRDVLKEMKDQGK